MGTEITEIERENPLRRFDEKVLKAMGSREVDAGAPRAMFLPANMSEAMELAKLMAAGNFVPPHLRQRPGDCLAVVMQATRWAMDPFAVGNKTYFVNDRIAYESQLVNAVINSADVLEGRLHPEWEGEGNDLVCTVTGKLRGDPQPKTRRVPINTITTRNSPLWKQDPQQQLAYFAMRAWVRLHAPEVLLGVYTPDELGAVEPTNYSNTGEKRRLTGAMLLDQAKPAAEQKAQTLAEELDDEIPHLDAKAEQHEAELANEGETEGQDEPEPDQEPEAAEEEESAADRILREITEAVAAADTKAKLDQIDKRWANHHRNDYADHEVAAIDKLITERRKALK